MAWVSLPEISGSGNTGMRKSKKRMTAIRDYIDPAKEAGSSPGIVEMQSGNCSDTKRRKIENTGGGCHIMV